MPEHPKVVSYKWVGRDTQVARKEIPSPIFVTPYGLIPQYVEKAASHEPGSMVNVVLSKSVMPGWVTRFFPGDEKFEWATIPDSISRSGSIADLCAALFAHNPNRYVAAYYDFSKKSAGEKNQIALLLFDYWGNTEYRHAVLNEGFDWDTLQERTPSLPAQKGEQKILYALAKRPLVIPLPVAPGVQIVRPPHPGLELITADIARIATLAKRIKQLLVQSEEIMRQRVLLTADIGALHSLFQASATSKSEPTMEAQVLAARAASTQQTIKDAMLSKSMKELVPKDKHGLLTPEIEQIVRGKLGYTDDIAGEVQRLSNELRGLLLDSQEFADRCAEWANYAFRNNLCSTAAYQRQCDGLMGATAEALLMLAETQADGSLADRLWKIIKDRPEGPARSEAEIGTGTRAALGVIFSIVGGGAKSAPTFVGNAAGPPSLSVAAIQAAAASAFVDVVREAAKGDAAKLDAMIDRVFDGIRTSISASDDLQKRLKDARAARNWEVLHELRHEIAEVVGGKIHSSLGWKSTLGLLQFLGCIVAISDLTKAPGKDGMARKLYNFADASVQTGAAVASLTEAGIQALGNLEEARMGLAKIGVALGRLSAILGMVGGLLDLHASINAPDNRGLRQIAATASFFGGYFMFVGMLPWLTPIPFFQYVGLALVAMNVLVTAAVEINTPSKEGKPLGTNIVARAVVASMKSNPFYSLLLADTSLASDLERLEVGARGALLPYAENTALVIDMLWRAGFTKKERAMIVNTDADPPAISLEGMLVKGI